MLEEYSKGWSCLECTFKNVIAANECEVCEADRPKNAYLLKNSKKIVNIGSIGSKN
jgi:hypothetical protein